MTFTEWAEKHSRQILCFLLLVVTLYPIMSPIGLPISIGQPTKDLYNGIEAIPAGSNVLYCPDFGAGNIPELSSVARVVLQQLLNKPVKIVIVTFTWDDSALAFTTSVLPRVNVGNKIYGVDYVFLGWIAGGEVSMAAFASDIPKTSPIDFYGKPTKDMPIMQNIKTAKDFSYLIVVGGSDLPYYVRQLQARYGLKMGAPTQTVAYPGIMPYYTAGQIFGTTNGLRGAAEYEILSGRLGDAAAASDAISTSHVLIMAFIILGNVGYFYNKYRKGK